LLLLLLLLLLLEMMLLGQSRRGCLGCGRRLLLLLLWGRWRWRLWLVLDRRRQGRRLNMMLLLLVMVGDGRIQALAFDRLRRDERRRVGVLIAAERRADRRVARVAGRHRRATALRSRRSRRRHDATGYTRLGDRSRRNGGCLSAGIQCFGGRSASWSSSSAAALLVARRLARCATFAVLSMTSLFHARFAVHGRLYSMCSREICS